MVRPECLAEETPIGVFLLTATMVAVRSHARQHLVALKNVCLDVQRLVVSLHAPLAVLHHVLMVVPLVALQNAMRQGRI